MTEKIESGQDDATEQSDDAAAVAEEQSLEEAQASFTAGHKKVSEKHDYSTSPASPDEPEKDDAAKKPDEAGDTPEADTKKEDGAEKDAGEKPDAGGKQEEGKQDEPDPVFQLQRRMRKVEGKIGGISDKLDSLNEALKQKAEDVSTSAEAGETKEQIDAALKNLKDLEALGEDMEALKPVIDELKDLRASMATREKQPDDGQATTQPSQQLSAEELVEQVTLNVKHPGWERTTQSPEFKAHVLQGGPTAEEYAEYAALLNDQKTQHQADELVKGWAEDFPNWWKDRGQRFFEAPNGVADSISLLDEFSGLQKKATDKQNQQQQQQARKTKRLASALAPDGVEDDPVKGIDDEAAFARGHKKVASKSLT